MQKKITVKEQYGPLKPGGRYNIVSTERDHVRLKYKGGTISVPKSFVSYENTNKVRKERYEQTYEEIIEQENF